MSKDNPQDYRGNGEHGWERVQLSMDGADFDYTSRLRVPGGWLYRNTFAMSDAGEITGPFVNVTFVPMPEVVKHKV
jgi:hypothetical protein